ncbi:hypothetical protein BJX70DRAFT_57388 [Aspergillus crustosus]
MFRFGAHPEYGHIHYKHVRIRATFDEDIEIDTGLPELLPIDHQIQALDRGTHTDVIGDQPINQAYGYRGFSLTRMMLAHDSELDPNSPYYFLLNARKMSDPPEEAQEQRIRYILHLFPFDDQQKVTFNTAINSMKCGIQIIHGPPGTGKSRVGMVIVLVLACPGIKVMLSSRTSNAVDTLSAAIIRTLNRHPRIRSWVGSFVRLRALSRQLSEIRSRSCEPKAHRDMVSSSSNILEPYEKRDKVLRYAEQNFEKYFAYDKFLYLIEIDRMEPLASDNLEALAKIIEDITKVLLREARIVVTTLSDAEFEPVRDAFMPAFLICDNAQHSTEGEHAIAMTLESLRAVITIGDLK